MIAPDPLASKIEQAIDALLRAIIATEGLGTAGSLGAHLSLIAIEEGAVTAENLDKIIANPVGAACRSEIAALGSLLFDTVGTLDTMAAVVDRVVGLDQTGENARRCQTRSVSMDVLVRLRRQRRYDRNRSSRPEDRAGGRRLPPHRRIGSGRTASR